MTDEGAAPHFNWTYCECGCHGSEFRLGNTYFWMYLEFDRQEGENTLYHLNDGHKWGSPLGTFESLEALEAHILPKVEAEAERLLADVKEVATTIVEMRRVERIRERRERSRKERQK